MTAQSLEEKVDIGNTLQAASALTQAADATNMAAWRIAIEERLGKVESGLQENTTLTAQSTGMMTEVHEFVTMWKRDSQPLRSSAEGSRWSEDSSSSCSRSAASSRRRYSRFGR